MNAAVYLEFDGAPVPASELVWTMVAACGCVCGMTMVDPPREPVLTTADMAWSAFYEGAAELKRRHQSEGAIMRLVRRDTLPRLTCEHDPKWGVSPIPELDGYEWAVASMVGKRGRRQHLVPAVRDRHAKTAAICGSEDYGFAWHPEWHYTDLIAECMRCIKRATT